MIAPSYWVDPKSGQDYMLTVQYTEGQVKSLADLRAISLRASGSLLPTRLDTISSVKRVQAPTEVDHYQIRRVTDIYVRPLGEELGAIADRIDQIIGRTKIPEGLNVTMRGMVQGMRASFRSFAIGLTLSVVCSISFGGPIPQLCRSTSDSIVRPARSHRRTSNTLVDRHHTERNVAHGCRDVNWNRGFE
jgi:hypothetical protein